MVSRRQVIRAVGGAGVSLSTGCLSGGGDPDSSGTPPPERTPGAIVVVNTDDEEHRIELAVVRRHDGRTTTPPGITGTPIWTRTASATVSPGDRKQVYRVEETGWYDLSFSTESDRGTCELWTYFESEDGSTVGSQLGITIQGDGQLDYHCDPGAA